MKSLIPKALSVIVFTFIIAAGASTGYALTIDFETVPGTTPSDQLAISNQYEPLYGVTFSMSDGSVPHLEAVGGGDPGVGYYWDAGGVYDEASTGYEAELGEYFLRFGTSGLEVAPAPTLIITYTTPVSAASAQIWDIDAHNQGYEQWRVQAWDATDSLVESLYSPVGLLTSMSATLDGLPWTWSFDHGTTADIYKITLDFVGTKESGIGLAFDKFNTSEAAAVPEPSTLLLLGSGLVGLVGFRRRFGQ